MMKITAHEICSSVANQLGTLPKKAFAMHDALELIAITEGVCPSRNARFFAATVGAAMEIFDEIYDKNPVARAHKYAGIINTALANGANDQMPEPLSRAFRMVDGVATTQAREELARLALAQERSIAQRESGLTYSVVIDITQEKGGHSVLLLALQINPHLTPEQQSCYRSLGYLVQLCDDYVDQQCDRRDGIITMMHFMDDTKSREHILREATRTKLLFQRYYPAKRLQDLFLRIDRLLQRSGISAIA